MTTEQILWKMAATDLGFIAISIMRRRYPPFVIAGLDPAIHFLTEFGSQRRRNTLSPTPPRRPLGQHLLALASSGSLQRPAKALENAVSNA